MSRRGATRPKSAEAITVLGRQGLGSKAHLVIVQTEDARYVLTVTEQRVNVIDRLPVQAVPDAAGATPVLPAPKQESFDRVLTAAAEARPLEHPYPLRVRQRQDPLRGSILSAQTWRQTAEALRRSR